jgi:hypothetical protein
MEVFIILAVITGFVTFFILVDQLTGDCDKKILWFILPLFFCLLFAFVVHCISLIPPIPLPDKEIIMTTDKYNNGIIIDTQKYPIRIITKTWKQPYQLSKKTEIHIEFVPQMKINDNITSNR